MGFYQFFKDYQSFLVVFLSIFVIKYNMDEVSVCQKYVSDSDKKLSQEE